MGESYAELAEQVSALREQVTNQQRVIDSHQALLARLFLSEERQPAGPLKLLQELCLELLQLVHQICDRHHISYWLDCGSLLGAVRHRGFIPWDDDIDIGMARPDYVRFLDVLDIEIERLGLGDHLTPTRLRFDPGNIRVTSGHLQLKCGTAQFIPSMLDVFAYDYISASGAARYDEVAYRQAAMAYRKNLATAGIVTGFVAFRGNTCLVGGGMSDAELASLAERGMPLGVTLGEERYLTPGFDSVKYRRAIPVEQLLPTSTVAFCERDFAAPRDIRAYLTGMYGPDYLELPSVIETHTRLYWLRRARNPEGLLESLLSVMSQANARF